MRSVLEYCSVLWNNSQKTFVNTLEAVQRKATNYILNNPKRPSPQHVEYKERLLICGLLPLTYRREIADIIFLVLSIQNKIHFKIFNYIEPSGGRAGTRLAHRGLDFKVPVYKRKVSSQFYIYRAVKTWNVLPVDVRTKLLNAVNKNSIKNILLKLYKQKLSDHFDTDNTCTWVVTCQCGRCGNI